MIDSKVVSLITGSKLKKIGFKTISVMLIISLVFCSVISMPKKAYAAEQVSIETDGFIPCKLHKEIKVGNLDCTLKGYYGVVIKEKNSRTPYYCYYEIKPKDPSQYFNTSGESNC